MEKIELGHVTYCKKGCKPRIGHAHITDGVTEYCAFVGARGGDFRKWKTLKAMDEAFAKIGYIRKATTEVPNE